MKWNKCPAACIRNPYYPQEGNMEAMRHDAVRRIIFLVWENKYSRQETAPIPRQRVIKVETLCRKGQIKYLGRGHNQMNEAAQVCGEDTTSWLEVETMKYSHTKYSNTIHMAAFSIYLFFFQ